MQLYCIGGSPCSGKSTAARRLAKQHNFLHYKLDDRLFKFMRRAATAGNPHSKAYFARSTDEIWLRAPAEQAEDELCLYREMFAFVRADLLRLAAGRPVVAEGAGLLPELMQALGVDTQHYICLVPTPDFQVKHYQQRKLVFWVLLACSNRKQAFKNWMQRDILFARFVAQSAKALGQQTLFVDGQLPPDGVCALIAKHFQLLSKTSVPSLRAGTD